MVRAGARLILGLLVLIGPVVGFWLESVRVGGNAEQAISGLAWGALASVVAAIGLALLARGSGIDRFKWFAVSMGGALALWLMLAGVGDILSR
ncbi:MULTISPECIES: hypothetical protein [unclassified Brevundimonas]|mgnify:CR=1 FL=1|jgi:hypothetical protein|uniref:hypothetical protein n=1 Tax=unclassified Brevundimonas TaxID=2622653 RepID=UPI000C5B0D80|nr:MULTISPECIES: hypothetical protein [unclassified Brevundimonas]MAL88533.1 hypothetical protein [Brevundimonas sp.]|tara:strand:- start:76 stop:354 length:279 start_codon:yes stop_codon:yes gene_type:complete